MTPNEPGEASYAVLARVLNAMFGWELDNRHVANWADRRTRNKDGVPFPDPVREVPAPRRGQPHWLFSVQAVIEWARAGVPGESANQHDGKWKVPGGE